MGHRGEGFMWYPIYKRELKASLHSPVIYVLAGVFFFLMSYFTLGMMIEFAGVYSDYNMRQMYGMANMNVTDWIVRGFFGLMNFLMLFMIPLLTMRLFAEERRNRTYDLLVTCPVRDGDILTGKFLAALTIILALLAACFIFPLLLEHYSSPEWPVVLAGYLGMLLTILAYIAFGIFASSVTENQIISAFLSFAGLLFFYLIGDVTSSQEGWKGAVASALSIRQHTLSFAKGVIELKDVFYFCAFTFLFLFLSLEVLKVRRWRT
jgi:ABC-2 type transport system permease protein